MSHQSRPDSIHTVRIFAVILAAVIIIGGGCFIAGGIWLANNPLFSHTCFNGDRSALERYAHFKYPSDASDIHEDCFIWQGGDVRIWFVMDATDLDSFVATTLVKPPLGQTRLLPEFGPAVNQDALLYGEYQGGPNEGHIGQYLWIDMSNPARYLVILRFAEP